MKDWRFWPYLFPSRKSVADFAESKSPPPSKEKDERLIGGKRLKSEERDQSDGGARRNSSENGTSHENVDSNKRGRSDSPDADEFRDSTAFLKGIYMYKHVGQALMQC